MGAYQNDQAAGDFELASNGHNHPIFDQFVAVAKTILAFVPDNRYRDLAVSGLLESAELVSSAIAAEKHRKELE